MVGTTSKRTLLLFALACFLTTEGRGLSEVVGRRRRSTGEEVNLSETSTDLAKTLRRVRRSSVNEDEYGDYPDYDSEQDYPASDTNYEDTPEEKESVATPKFVSQPKVVIVNEGDTIRLPCFVDDSDSTKTMIWIWKFGDQILALNERPYDADASRVKIETGNGAGNQLVMMMANKKDEGKYICQVSAAENIFLEHTVKIRVRPEVEPEQELVRVESGSEAKLACKVTQGSPMPKISWRRKERPMPTGGNSLEGDSITFPAANRHFSGVYICSADNGWSQPATAEVRLDVQHVPVVEAHQLFVHNREGEEVDITCTVHASPPASVTWMKGNAKLSSTGRWEGEEGETRAIDVQRKGNRHTLILPPMGEEGRSGEYQCLATNSLGSSSGTVEVGRRPHIRFLSPSTGDKTTRYLLSWEVRSPTPAFEFLVEHRETGKEAWMTTLALASIESGERYSGLLELKDLKPGTSYQTRVSVKTGSGLGRSSQMFVFTTAEKEVGEEARRGEEEVVEEEEKKEEKEVDEEEMERMGKAVILPSHLPSPASNEEEELLQEYSAIVTDLSATGDKVTKVEGQEGSGQSQVVRFEEGSGEGSGKGASSGPKVIGNDAAAAMEKPKQEKSVSGAGDTNGSSNLHQKSALLLLFTTVAAFWLSK